MTINCVTRIPWAKYFVTLLKRKIEHVSKHNVLAARVELLHVSWVAVKSKRVAVSKSPANLLTCNNSTLAAKTLFLDKLFKIITATSLTQPLAYYSNDSRDKVICAKVKCVVSWLFVVCFVQRQCFWVRRSPRVSLNARTIKDELHVCTHRTFHKMFEALPEHTNLGNGLTSEISG